MSGSGEFLERDAPFGLQADIDQDEFIFDSDDGALEHTAFEAGAGTEGFLEQRSKRFGLRFFLQG
jgi:hypothetical protein